MFYSRKERSDGAIVLIGMKDVTLVFIGVNIWVCRYGMDMVHICFHHCIFSWLILMAGSSFSHFILFLNLSQNQLLC